MQPIEMFRFARKYLDAILMTAVGSLLLMFSGAVATEFRAERWDLGAFYSAVFDWSSIQSAFLFGIYAFVLSRAEPFVKAIAGTPAFSAMRAYVRHTVYIALALTAVTMPMLIAAPTMTDGSIYDVGYVLFVAYSLATVYVFARFLKVVRVFTKLERPGRS